MCQNVSEFIKNNSRLEIVKEIIEANSHKNRKVFAHLLEEIKTHLYEVEKMNTNEDITEFIRENEDAGVVIQIKEASEKKDRSAFSQLIKEIEGVIAIEQEVKRNKSRIQSHIASIKDIKREIKEQENLIKNGKNYHKIKRGR